MVESQAAPAKLDPVVLTDPRAIKALAHPARLAVIDEFFNGRKLTATECAEIAGISASAMSYHLRALEKWGIIKRSESSDDGRERPWEATGHGLRIVSDDPGSSSTGESILITRLLDRQRDEVLQWMNRPDRRNGGGRDWDDVMAIMHSSAWLTTEQARELGTTVEELLKRYAEAPSDTHPPGTRKVRLAYALIPLADVDAKPPVG
jgi:DNA-binding MarR family transcriptional regulator